MTLYPYQEEAVEWMVKTGNCLNACEVGLGKTVMALYAVKEIQTRKNLVVAPKILLPQWQEECSRILPKYKTFVVGGTADQRKKTYKAAHESMEPYFLIVSYEIARIDYELLLQF